MRTQLGLAAVVVCAACGNDQQVEPQGGDVARSLAIAAEEARVPLELLTAVAIEEGGVRLPAHRAVDPHDVVPVAGALELRRGRLDTLALGARLAETTEDHLRHDTDLGTRAGALVLAQLGAEHGAGATLESWRPALEALSGMSDDEAARYASRVYAVLARGGAYKARAGEMLVLAPHAIAPSDLAIAPRLVPADFDGAEWFTTSCSNKCTPGRPMGNGSVDKIVIHDTEGNWDASVATLQFDPGKSVHYIIDADGARVGQFRPETDTTWHAGNFFYNSTSIGIEHVGVASDPDGYAPALYATSRALVQDIRTRWDVPLDRQHIIGHYQIPDGTVISESSPPCGAHLDDCEHSSQFGGQANHRDPGYYWQWCQYMNDLGGSCTCNDAWPNWNCTTDKTQAVRCSDGVVEIADCTAGCEVMPLGTPDVCHVDPDQPLEQYPGYLVDDGDADNDGIPDSEQGGCAATGGGAGLALGVLLFRRRRRR